MLIVTVTANAQLNKFSTFYLQTGKMNIDYTNDGLHLLGKGYFEMGRERKTLYYTEMKKYYFYS